MEGVLAFAERDGEAQTHHNLKNVLPADRVVHHHLRDHRLIRVVHLLVQGAVHSDQVGAAEAETPRRADFLLELPLLLLETQLHLLLRGGELALLLEERELLVHLHPSAHRLDDVSQLVQVGVLALVLLDFLPGEEELPNDDALLAEKSRHWHLLYPESDCVAYGDLHSFLCEPETTGDVIRQLEGEGKSELTLGDLFLLEFECCELMAEKRNVTIRL